MRRARDPIERVRNLLIEHDIIKQDALKKVEKSIKKEVNFVTNPSESKMHVIHYAYTACTPQLP